MINGYTRARKRAALAKRPKKADTAFTMEQLNAMGRAELVEAAKAAKVKFKGSFDSIRKAILEAQK